MMTGHSSPTAEARSTKNLGPTAHSNALRQWFAIDERESLITQSQTFIGKLLIADISILAVTPHLGSWTSALAVTGAMVAASRSTYRARIIFITTWVTAFVGLWLGEYDTLDHIKAVMDQEKLVAGSPSQWATASLLILCLAVVALLNDIRRRPQSLISKRPLVTLLVIETVLCLLGNLDAVHGFLKVALWSGIFVLTPYIWFLVYAIVDQRARIPPEQILQLGVVRPFWSPSYLPFGKGAAFLQKHQAATSRDLGITQLKAVKLLVWANVLFAITEGLDFVFIGQLHLPSVSEAINAYLNGTPFTLFVNWSSLVLSTTRFSLQIAIWAHVFIGLARLVGYKLPRGSWRPLESQTLMDYFNRFHFYFKELLVDFFFIPTFFKMFRSRPRFRMFFATFMAAGVGNALWHFFRDVDFIAKHGIVEALTTFTSYAFYSVVLATCVGLSQVRAQIGIRPSSTWIGRIYCFLFVWTFVTCMHIFSDGSRDHTLIERLYFLASLFGAS
jgi:hypothetical protein